MTDSVGGSGSLVNRMAIAVMSLVGFFICLYLVAHYYGLTGPLVCGVGDCAAVQASPYAKIGGFPLSLFGVAGYVVLLGASFVGIQPGMRNSKLVSVALLGAATFGVGVSGYLTYLEAAVIHAWCQWCVISAVLMTLIFLATFPEIARLQAGDSEAT